MIINKISEDTPIILGQFFGEPSATVHEPTHLML